MMFQLQLVMLLKKLSLDNLGRNQKKKKKLKPKQKLGWKWSMRFADGYNLCQNVLFLVAKLMVTWITLRV